MVGLALKVLVSGSWNSPTITMMQNTCKNGTQGSIISAHFFYTTVASTISPILFNGIVKNFNTALNPGIYGILLTIFCGVGYLGSVPFFWKAGREFKK